MANIKKKYTAELITHPVTIDWDKSFGGSKTDMAHSIQQTTDGGYIIAGLSNSDERDFWVNRGEYDYWIVKLTSKGRRVWQKSFGGSKNDVPYSIQQTTDGGYIIAGYSESNDWDVTKNYGKADYWIVKLNSKGKYVWQKSLGGIKTEIAQFIQQTTDGGYIIAGGSESNDGDVSGNYGGIDYWIVKLNSKGELEWQRHLGGSSDDVAYCIQQTNDGGYIIAGGSESNDVDVSGNHGRMDYWIVKLTLTGELDWQKSLGGSYDEYAYSIQQTTDGGYIIAGSSGSSDGDLTKNCAFLDCWIVKLTSLGELKWQRNFGDTYNDVAYYIQQTTDGDYIFAGTTTFHKIDTYRKNLKKYVRVIDHYDYWVVKISEKNN